MKMNKNVIHSGQFLEKGSECPAGMEKEMHAQGHLDISSLTVSEEMPAEEKESEKPKHHKKGK